MKGSEAVQAVHEPRWEAPVPDWIERELAGCSLPDVRLDSRLARLVSQLSGPLGQSIPMACQDWANTKAAYRFFDNPRVNEAGILAGHFQATRERFDVTEDPVLVLHDTTESSFQRESSTAIGVTNLTLAGHSSRSRMHTVCGILMHASFVVTTDGLPSDPGGQKRAVRVCRWHGRRGKDSR